MKNIFKISIFVFVTLFVFACESDDKSVAQGVTGPVIETPNTAVLLDETLQDNPAFTVVWSHGDYDVNTSINYTVEMARVSTDFADPVVVSITTDRFYSWTVGELNKNAIEAGLVAGEEGSVEIRIKSSIGIDDVDEFISESSIVTTTPYATDTGGGVPRLYIVGSFSEVSGYGPNWNPSETTPAIAAEDADGTSYEGFVFFNDATANYKFLPTNIDFEGDYGDASGTDGSYTEMLVQEGEGNCGLPAGAAAGYYLVKADLTDDTAITYSVEPANWAVTGNATPNGWPSDTVADHDMTYDPDTKLWTITLALTQQDAPDNGIKFRANDDWALNIGDNDEDGTMEFGGGNMSVPAAGTYLITLDLSNPRAYTYSLTPQ